MSGEPVAKFVGNHMAAIALIIATLIGWGWTASGKNSELAAYHAEHVKLAAVVEAVKADVSSAEHERTQMRVDLATIKRDLQWLVSRQGGPAVTP